MGNTQSHYPPIEDYGLVGNCHSAALISSKGSIDWLCLPRFDSPALFARILDLNSGGGWSIQPLGMFQSRHQYMPLTNVLETLFTTGHGRARLLDCMPVSSAPGDARGAVPHVLLRVVEGIDGEVEIESRCEPRPDYARQVPEFTARGREVVFDRFVLLGPGEWQVDPTGGAVAYRMVVRPGDRLAFLLYIDDGTATPVLDDPFQALEQTVDLWHDYAERCSYHGPYRDAVIRSVLTLKLLTDWRSGAIIAAPTTSLPEEIGGIRNWDYRFTWIRDASFTLYALLLAGYVEEDDPFFRWIVDTVKLEGSGIKILYPISPEGLVGEQTLDHLDGYRGSRPVRIGNGAADQIQLDVYGEVIDALHFACKVGQFDPAPVWRFFRPIVDWVVDNWNQPESGIWEVRGGLRNFVYGKAMCWIALDRAIDIATDYDLPGDIDRWRQERDRIRADVLEKGWSERLGAFKQSYEDEVLDASNLLLPIVGFIEGDDPRIQSTIDATLDRLVVDGLCYRYLEAPEGLSGGEASFVLCTFWLVDALILAGREEEAKALFEGILGRATSLGLFAEEIDPSTGAHLGNFPQAFSHIGVINAAVSLAHVGKVGQVDARHLEQADLCKSGVAGVRRTRRARETAQQAGDQECPPDPETEEAGSLSGDASARATPAAESG